MAALRCQVQEEVVLSYKWSWLLGVACELNISRDVYFSEGTHRSSRRDSALNIGFGKSLVTWGIISFPLCLLLFLTMKDFSGRGLVFLQWDFLICIDHFSYSGHFSWYGDGIFSKLTNALQWRYLTLHSLFDDLVCTKSGILDLIARPSYHVQTFPNGGPLCTHCQNRDLRLSKRRPKDGSWLWPWPITRTLGKHSWTDLWIVKPCETEDISESWVPQSWQSLSDLTIKSDTGQHSQFLQCLESFQTFGKHNDS